MALVFAAEQATHPPQLYALYVLVYITVLAAAVIDFLAQTWNEARRSRRLSQRIGLRAAAAGCLVALLYAAYKVAVVVSLGLGLGFIPRRQQCSTLLIPLQCAFSVSAPALAALLITLGLTLPAMSWPISQWRRQRWENRSHAALGRLWSDLTSTVPEVVLNSTETDPDFLLHRRVVEINDGILSLRQHRSPRVQEAAQRACAANSSSEPRAAIVEAAILRAAVQAKRGGALPLRQVAPPSPETDSREGNLRAETEWLLHVAHAYDHDDIVRVTAQTGRSAPAGSEA
ncbi:hypothetical protein AN219_37925 [Streptomyces nanshensis]|nr:hypothetical protein AN219_37925 [Streptomyces nanshensis]